MDNLTWQKVETIVDQALEVPADQREDFISKKCGNDEQLKGQVTEFLASIFHSEGWLDNPADYKEELYEEIGTFPSHESLVGKKVGSYTIKEKIGEGGMGAVYRALREGDTFEHEVAIKIIRHERATDENIRRFRREQRILAGFSHPGIARLFDGGVTEDGYPYIIMEYVDGIPIDEFCQNNGCSTKDKIALFQQILEAVRYAHENLVIHRDLKPANILVNADGDIKILDFGISKLLEKEKHTSDITQNGTRLLTPRYAAPEQITDENITTATDLYALGIILYELLSGKGPFDLDECSQYNLEQIILHELPPKPSTKAVSKKVRKKLQGDLDAIVLKAIRKDSNQRYRITNDLIEDLNRYKNGLPVSVRIESLTYRVKKFIGRHTISIAATFLMIVLSVGFLILHTSRITQERNNAELEARKATQIKTLLSNILQQQNPFAQPDRDITLAQVLDDGLKNIESSLDNQPEVKAELLGLLGDNFASLGDFEKSEALVKQALDLYNPSQLQSALQTYVNNLARLGRIQYRTGRFDEAESSYFEALELVKREYGPDSNQATHLYGSLASIYREKGQLLKTEEFYKRAIALADTTQKIALATSLGNLAIAYRDQRQFKKALNLHKESLTLERQIRDTLHPDLASAYNNIAFTYQQKGDFQKADSLHQISLSMRRKLFPPDHHHIASSLVRLGLLKIKQFHTQEAEEYLEEGYEILNNKLPEEHWQVLSAKGGLAVSRAMQGEFENNVPVVEDVYQQFVDKFGVQDWRSREAALALTNLYRAWGKPEQASFYAERQ
ncbi:serine/threonine-protein kinase [Fodinibius salsisoli]|uniref:Serine/threonine protein kinase n=1 Tax=Fodinibius salsisoli TaxID=2820877 RepID=A0ABT3PMM5_9BACT|nr:serine/threonine-protein kinase [Fodinibius salsisoli]MCW9707190.1 serine/threonine protein kinase [Fodinibius salsisoli]